MSDSLQPHGLYGPWKSPGQNIGVGSLSLLQGIFPIQGLNPGLPHCKHILYQLSHKGMKANLKLCLPCMDNTCYTCPVLFYLAELLELYHTHIYGSLGVGLEIHFIWIPEPLSVVLFILGYLTSFSSGCGTPKHCHLISEIIVTFYPISIFSIQWSSLEMILG